MAYEVRHSRCVITGFHRALMRLHPSKSVSVRPQLILTSMNKTTLTLFNSYSYLHCLRNARWTELPRLPKRNGALTVCFGDRQLLTGHRYNKLYKVNKGCLFSLYAIIVKQVCNLDILRLASHTAHKGVIPILFPCSAINHRHILLSTALMVLSPFLIQA